MGRRKQKISRVLALVLTAVMTLSLLPTSMQVQAKEKTALEAKKVTMETGASRKILLLNNSSAVTWSTSNSKVAKITAKSKKYVKIKAVKKGTAKITAKIGSKKYTCKVTVKNKQTRLEEKTLTMTVGTQQKLKLLNNKKSVKWSTSDKSVLSLGKKTKSYAVLNAVGAGTATVTAKVGLKKYKCTINVETEAGSTEGTTEETKTESPTETTEETKTPAETPTEQTNYTRLQWIKDLLKTLDISVMTDEAVGGTYSYQDLESAEDKLAVETAVKRGILVPGNGDASFHPEETAAREFAAATAVRGLGYTGKNGDAPESSDKESLAYPALDKIAVDKKLVILEDGKFNPDKALTLQEGKAMLEKVTEVLAGFDCSKSIEEITYAKDLHNLEEEVKQGKITGLNYSVEKTDNGFTVTVKGQGIHASDFQKDETVMLPANNEYPDSFACHVDSVKDIAGGVEIQGSAIEDFRDVFENIHIKGEVSGGQITLAEGVTRKSDAEPEAQTLSTGDGFSELLEEESNVRLESEEISEEEISEEDLRKPFVIEGEAGLKAELKFDGPTIGFEFDGDTSGINTLTAYVKNTQSLTFSCEGKLQNKPLKVFRISLPVKAGFKAQLTVYVVISAEGKISYTVSCTEKMGFSIDSYGNVSGINEIEPKHEAEVSASVSAGLEMQLAFVWLDEDLLNVADVTLGVGGRATYEEKAGKTNMGKDVACRDVNLFLYGELKAGYEEKSLLHKLKSRLKITLEWDFWNKDTSPHKKNWHFEADTGGTYRRQDVCTAANKKLSGGVYDWDNTLIRDGVVVKIMVGTGTRTLEVKNGKFETTVASGTYNVSVVSDDEDAIPYYGGIVEVSGSDTMANLCRNIEVTRQDNVLTCRLKNLAYWGPVGTYLNAQKDNYDTICMKGSTQVCRFSSLSNLVAVDLSGLDTSGMTSAYSMFSGCTKLETIDFTGCDFKNVTDMVFMFSGCQQLTGLDIGDWNTSKVTNMQWMFSNCKSLTGLDLEDWDTSNVTEMSQMFNNCSSLTDLAISSWETGNVRRMNSMFRDCENLTSLDLNDWNTEKLEDMSGIFQNCHSLANLSIRDWEVKNVTSMGNMGNVFYGCDALKRLDLSGWKLKSITNMSSMFSGYKNFEELNLSNWAVEHVENMEAMFYNCTNLKKLKLDNWNLKSLTNMKRMFVSCKALEKLDLETWNTSKIEDMESVFWGCNSLKDLRISSWDVSNVTNMSWMFFQCQELENLDIADWDVSNVTKMDSMFKECQKLSRLDVNNWNTENVTDMYAMFHACPNLTYLNAGNWNTKKVTRMGFMFDLCSKLKTVNATNWDTGNVKDMSYMFCDCESLNSILISKWDTSSLTNMFYMFFNCPDSVIPQWYKDATSEEADNAA